MFRPQIRVVGSQPQAEFRLAPAGSPPIRSWQVGWNAIKLVKGLPTTGFPEEKRPGVPAKK